MAVSSVLLLQIRYSFLVRISRFLVRYLRCALGHCEVLKGCTRIVHSLCISRESENEKKWCCHKGRPRVIDLCQSRPIRSPQQADLGWHHPRSLPFIYKGLKLIVGRTRLSFTLFSFDLDLTLWPVWSCPLASMILPFDHFNLWP